MRRPAILIILVATAAVALPQQNGNVKFTPYVTWFNPWIVLAVRGQNLSTKLHEQTRRATFCTRPLSDGNIKRAPQSLVTR